MAKGKLKLVGEPNLIIAFLSSPEKITELSFKFDTGEFLFLQYLIKETFGRGRLELKLSQTELSKGAKELWSNLADGTTISKRSFTAPQISKALTKFEKLGFISTSQQST